jgi:hypothetical protein
MGARWSWGSDGRLGLSNARLVPLDELMNLAAQRPPRPFSEREQADFFMEDTPRNDRLTVGSAAATVQSWLPDDLMLLRFELPRLSCCGYTALLHSPGFPACAEESSGSSTGSWVLCRDDEDPLVELVRKEGRTAA